jgi:ATP-binding cassette subfamily C protein CydCD
MSRPIDPRLTRAVPIIARMVRILLALQVLGGLLTIAQAAILADVIASVVREGVRGTSLVTPLVGLAGVGVGRALLGALQEWLTARTSLRAQAELRAAVLRAITRLGPGWASRQPTGRLVTAAGPGLDGLDGYLTRAVPAIVSSAVVPMLVLARIGLADWQSALVLVVTLPLVPVFMALVGVTTRRRMQTQYATLTRLSGHFLDLVQGLTTLKVYGQARRQVETVRRATDDYRRQTLTTLRHAFLSSLVLDLIATLAVAVVAVDVGLRLDHGSLGLQTALLVLLLAPELFAPLRAVGAQYHAAEEGRVTAEAALDIIGEAANSAETQDRRTGTTISAPARGELIVTGVHVQYPGRTVPALRSLDLCLEPGELVAVQGVSGAGKSSVLAVLLGFVEPGAGTVTMGTAEGVSTLDAATADSWRSHLAWVPQRPTPTQRTVGEEVSMGDLAAHPHLIAAALADCHAPSADTELGEDGGAISAGQRRRVALARALLRARAVRANGSVPLVLLDEPSEDLDAMTAAVVAHVISGLAGWATVLIVTHSAALARIADRLILIEDGSIVADTRQHRVTAAAVQAVSSPSPIVLSVVESAGQSAPLRLLFCGVRGTGRRLAAAVLLSGVGGLAGLALTATSIWLICRAAEHPNVQALAIAVVGVRTFALARALLRYGERLRSHDVALRLLSDVRARVFAALEPLAPAGLAGFRRGDLLRRFVRDVDGTQEALVRAALPLGGAAITVSGAVGLACLIAPGAGAVLGVGLLIGLLVVPALTRRAAGSADLLTAATGTRDDRTNALLDGLAELSAYGTVTRARTSVTDADLRVIRAGRRPAVAAAAGAGLTAFVSAVTVPLVLAAGAASAADARMNPIEIGVLFACALVGFDALAPLPAAFAAWARCRAGLVRVAALLAAPLPIPDPAVATVVVAGSIGLSADAISVAPALHAGLVLDRAHLRLRAGERIAVIGASGSGKSTLLTAALRLLAVRAGRLEVTVNDDRTVALSALAADAVPPLAAGSLQGDHVFNSTLRDNLRLVRPEASDLELDAVASRAGLADFVDGLPQGWSTPAGPDGIGLSGGQRQRLLLARALLADPEILILDEPTAHLDPVTERAVLRDLLSNTRGHTVLMSSHRRLDDDEFDHIVRIENHLLVEQLDASPFALAAVGS